MRAALRLEVEILGRVSSGWGGVEGRGTTKQGENTKQSAYTAKTETDIVYLGASLQRTLATRMRIR